MLDRIYTGRMVPEGIAGSSTDQSSIPHPRVRVQDAERTTLNTAGIRAHRRDETLIFARV
jgi:hypothetical protein